MLLARERWRELRRARELVGEAEGREDHADHDGDEEAVLRVELARDDVGEEDDPDRGERVLVVHVARVDEVLDEEADGREDEETREEEARQVVERGDRHEEEGAAEEGHHDRGEVGLGRVGEAIVEHVELRLAVGWSGDQECVEQRDDATDLDLVVVIEVHLQHRFTRRELEHVIERHDRQHHHEHGQHNRQLRPVNSTRAEGAVGLRPLLPKVEGRLRLFEHPQCVVGVLVARVELRGVEVAAGRPHDDVEDDGRDDDEAREIERRLADVPPLQVVERQPDRKRRRHQHPRVRGAEDLLEVVAVLLALVVNPPNFLPASHVDGVVHHLVPDAREEAGGDVGRHEANDRREAVGAQAEERGAGREAHENK
mmetsp:Transcript_77333/g.232002  ORF Transcript_77333/g.232002 Transcript_77333/m.232002 type:complete len:370 (+) Transcript_77333:1375-2484(+)